MKKLFVCLLLLVSLCACKSTRLDDIYSDLDNIFLNINDIAYHSTNNNLNYYSYYLPSDMSEEELDSDSVVLLFGNSKIIMNLNISNIINSKYYSDYTLIDDGFFVKDYLIYSHEGDYLLKDGTQKGYQFNLYQYEDKYVIHLLTSDMVYYGSCVKTDIRNLARHLMLMAKNTKVSYDDVVTNFSKKDVITGKKNQIDLFNSVFPVNGALSDMLIEDAIVSDGSNITAGSNNGEFKDEHQLEIIDDNLEGN